MAVTDLDTALEMLRRNRSGAVWFTGYDEEEGFVSGRFEYGEDENNDPDGIGWFSIITEGGMPIDVPFNGFQELVECPVGTPV